MDSESNKADSNSIDGPVPVFERMDSSGKECNVK